MVMLLAVHARAEPSTPRSGATAEIAIGGGALDANESRTTVGGAAGVGGWVHPRVALSIRLNLLLYRRSYEYEPNALHGVFVLGPHAQVWPTRFLYVGVGGGLFTTSGGSTAGFEGRVGIALPSRCAHSWSLAASIIGIPEMFPVAGVVLLGYQHL
jgi:hypothetical protein